MMDKRNVFKYPDTNSSRAEIDYINARFYGLKVAIIGIGGTGSYILDHVAKTSVEEIHIYDGDEYHVHNAFRAPGATAADEFGKKGAEKKVDYFAKKYSEMHCGITPHAQNVDAQNIDELKGVDYVFVSVDKTDVRKFICGVLLKFGIPFIDCGMGMQIHDGLLLGTLRVTTSTNDKSDHVEERFGTVKDSDNIYATNIQVSELNCMNAVLAVIKWKKLVGFYQDLKQEHNSLYFINTNKLLNEDFSA
jgi:hypothetical protein